MIIGNVVGTVICTRKNNNLIGSKFLIVAPMEQIGKYSMGNKLVAVDNVGAGVGDIVLVSTGSSARIACRNMESPVDACIVGIVDDPQKIVIEER